MASAVSSYSGTVIQYLARLANPPESFEVEYGSNIVVSLRAKGKVLTVSLPKDSGDCRSRKKVRSEIWRELDGAGLIPDPNRPQYWDEETVTLLMAFLDQAAQVECEEASREE